MGNQCCNSADDIGVLRLHGDMFEADTRAVLSILEYCQIRYKLEKSVPGVKRQ